MATVTPKAPARTATPATRQNPPGTAVTAPARTQVALPASVAAELAQYAADDASKERPSLSKISFRGGMMTYLGNPIPGDNLDVIILAASFRQVWYAGQFDPDNIVNPNCFAISADGEDMAPHENVKEPVHTTCDGCPKNQWGTAVRDGKPTRGKACKENRRVIAIHVDALKSIEDIKSAEYAIMDISVTNLKNWSQYVNGINVSLRRPMWSLLTNVQLTRDMRTQFQVAFTPTETIDDAELLEALKERAIDAKRVVMTPFDETSLIEDNEAARKAAEASAKAASKFTPKARR